MAEEGAEGAGEGGKEGTQEASFPFFLLKGTYRVGAGVLVEVGESTSKSILTLGTENDVLGVLVDEDSPEKGKKKGKKCGGGQKKILPRKDMAKWCQ